MPISAEQWRAVVGCNNVRRPRQVSLKEHLLFKDCDKDTRTTEATDSAKIGEPFEQETTDCDDPPPELLDEVVVAKVLMSVVQVCVQVLQSFVSMVTLSLLILSGDVEINPGPIAHRQKLWDVPELKVHFLNPEVLSNPALPWRCGEEILTTAIILTWASVWNQPGTSVPIISSQEAREEEAHIRVQFKRPSLSAKSCSKVGNEARDVTDLNMPTMVLNLFGLTQKQQRSTVLHMFGHVLGLEHEHQRSDFWKILGAKDWLWRYRFIIGEDQMRSGESYDVNGSHIKCMRAGDQVFKDPRNETAAMSKYDPDSIMHYSFDIMWLKPEYRDLTSREFTRLKEEEKEVIRGVHRRRSNNIGNLPEEPSPIDRAFLAEEYKSKKGQYGRMGAHKQTEEQAPTMAVRYGPPTLEDLKRETGVTDDQLNLPCSDDHLLKISHDIDDFLTYAVKFGLDKGQKKTAAGKSEYHEKVYNVLNEWKGKNGAKATYKWLVEVSLDLQKGGVAGEICTLCANNEWLKSEYQERREKQSSDINTLSKLSLKEYNAEFTKLFIENMGIRDDIAMATLSTQAGNNIIYGVSIGLKEVVFQGHPEDRLSMVVLVNDVQHAKEKLLGTITKRVVQTINKSEEQKLDDEDDPFWINFVLHRPEFCTEAVFAGGTNGDVTARQPLPENPQVIQPGEQFITSDGFWGTIGLFVHADLKNGAKKLYGVTCAHVALVFGEPDTQFSSACQRCSQAVKMRMNEGKHMLLNSISLHRPNEIKKILSTEEKLFLDSSYQRPEIGHFENILYGVLEERNETSMCLECHGRIRSKVDPYHSAVVDLALFSVEQKNCVCNCSLQNIENVKWTLWNPSYGFPAINTTVYTFNNRHCECRSERPTNTDRDISACKRSAVIQVCGRVTSFVNDKLIRSPPYIRMRTNDVTNKRLFVDNGDSGSLLFLENGDQKTALGILYAMRNQHTNCTECPDKKVTGNECKAHSVCNGNNCSENPEGCRNPTLAYGFFLQPALDVVMSRAFFTDSRALEGSEETDKSEKTDDQLDGTVESEETGDQSEESEETNNRSEKSEEADESEEAMEENEAADGNKYKLNITSDIRGRQYDYHLCTETCNDDAVRNSPNDQIEPREMYMYLYPPCVCPKEKSQHNSTRNKNLVLVAAVIIVCIAILCSV